MTDNHRGAYTAISGGSGLDSSNSERQDVEDTELFDITAHTADTMEVADNDTLYYGVALGARRRQQKVSSVK